MSGYMAATMFTEEPQEAVGGFRIWSTLDEETGDVSLRAVSRRDEGDVETGGRDLPKLVKNLRAIAADTSRLVEWLESQR